MRTRKRIRTRRRRIRQFHTEQATYLTKKVKKMNKKNKKAANLTDFHGVSDEGFGVVKALKEDASGGHGRLREFEQHSGDLDQLCAEDAEVLFRLRVEAVFHRRRPRHFLRRDQNVF